MEGVRDGERERERGRERNGGREMEGDGAGGEGQSSITSTWLLHFVSQSHLQLQSCTSCYPTALYTDYH